MHSLVRHQGEDARLLRLAEQAALLNLAQRQPAGLELGQQPELLNLGQQAQLLNPAVARKSEHTLTSVFQAVLQLHAD